MNLRYHEQEAFNNAASILQPLNLDELFSATGNDFHMQLFAHLIETHDADQPYAQLLCTRHVYFLKALPESHRVNYRYAYLITFDPIAIYLTDEQGKINTVTLSQAQQDMLTHFIHSLGSIDQFDSTIPAESQLKEPLLRERLRNRIGDIQGHQMTLNNFAYQVTHHQQAYLLELSHSLIIYRDVKNKEATLFIYDPVSFYHGKVDLYKTINTVVWKLGQELEPLPMLPTRLLKMETIPRSDDADPFAIINKRHQEILSNINHLHYFEPAMIENKRDETITIIQNMLFLEGHTLSHYIGDDDLSEKDLILLAAHIAKALHEQIHQHNWIHRDIKDGNLLIQRDRSHTQLVIYWIDFDDACSTKHKKNDATGTPVYRAPEAVLTKKSDIYSLGITLLGLFTRQIITPNNLTTSLDKLKKTHLEIYTVINNLLDPSPKKRSSAKKIYASFKKIAERTPSNNHRSLDTTDIDNPKLFSRPPLNQTNSLPIFFVTEELDLPTLSASAQELGQTSSHAITTPTRISQNLAFFNQANHNEVSIDNPPAEKKKNRFARVEEGELMPSTLKS